MKTPEESLAEISSILFSVEEQDLTVREYGCVINALTELRNLPSDVMPGLYRLSGEIVRSSEAIIDSHNRMREIVKRLRNS